MVLFKDPFLNACMVLQVVMSSLREFHNLAPYMEMHMDFTLVRNQVTGIFTIMKVADFFTKRNIITSTKYICVICRV